MDPDKPICISVSKTLLVYSRGFSESLTCRFSSFRDPQLEKLARSLNLNPKPQTRNLKPKPKHARAIHDLNLEGVAAAERSWKPKPQPYSSFLSPKSARLCLLGRSE